VLKLRITIDSGNVFEFESDASAVSVVDDVIPLVHLWFQAIDPSTPIGAQMAKLAAARAELTAAVDRQRSASSTS
jgi:hypothetical protein